MRGDVTREEGSDLLDAHEQQPLAVLAAAAAAASAGGAPVARGRGGVVRLER